MKVMLVLLLGLILNFPFCTGSIGDLVWNDLDADGVQDLSEPGIAGAVVQLTLPDGTLRQATTDSAGLYIFENLPPGLYHVDVLGMRETYFATTNNHPQVVNLEAEQNYRDADFGYVHPTGLGIQLFEVSASPRGVILRWEASGSPTQGFQKSFSVWRSDQVAHWSFRASLPMSADGHYEFIDLETTIGLTYLYWLEDVSRGEFYGPRSVTLPWYKFLPSIGE